MNVGVYIPNWVGDAVMALPFLAHCRDSHVNDRIVAIAREWVVPVVKNSPFINDMLRIANNEDKGVAGATQIGRQLKSKELDRLYLLSGSWRSAYIGWFSGAEERIGYTGQGRSPLLTEIITPPSEKTHRSKRYLNLLKEYDTTAELTAQIAVTDDEVASAKVLLESLNMASPLAIFSGSMAPSRRPPTTLWKGIIEFALNSGISVLLVGGKRDVPIAMELMESFPARNLKSVCGKTSLRETIALISQCAGAIASDSGLGHISANLGVPTVSLFGAGDPEVTAPFGNSTKIIFQNVHCSPCKKNQCHNSDMPLLCHTTMDPGQVWEAYSVVSGSEKS
ncbi:MAG TPA: lipopolysaccharide heptosyltransferase II [Candidatus Marinimicrobia bacterium]|nr:lipopolysaccharide heptosyltransferase II [Candidatus Neomarinimicrobiota bacterium]